MTDPQNVTGQQLVRCEVTDQMVPEDETVVINGMRVSAQGKALLMEQIKTGESMPGELEAPGWIRRWACSVVDGIVMFAIAFPLGLIVGGLSVGAGNTQTPVVLQSGAELLAAIAGVIYFTAMHAARGQSLGKMLGKFRVTRLDGSKISAGQALVRALTFSGISAISPLAVILLSLTSGGQSDQQTQTLLTVAGAVSALAGLYWLATVICVLAHPQKRALHDLIAGTRVVMIEN